MLKSYLLEIIANGENSLATREQQTRLFATGGLLHMEVLPVSGTSIESEVLRDYGYVDARGMGIRTKVIPLMRKENATEPVFEATDDYVKTVLFRRQTGLGYSHSYDKL